MLKSLIVGALVLVSACSQPTAAPSAQSGTSEMPMTGAPATAVATGPITGTGVVTQVDAAAGTVTFNHQAIAAINWPAMTMQFHAESAAMLQGIAVGDHVTFQLKSATEPQVVTMVQKQ